MSDLARQRLKEIRTLQGFDAAYKAAGLPDDGAKRNTQMKRLSRLINRQTGGFKELDRKQSQRINRTYRRREKKGVFVEARADRQFKQENRRLAGLRRDARRAFGEGGTSPNPERLARRLRQYAPLKPEDRERFIEMQKNASEDGGVGLRREYAKMLNRVRLIDLPKSIRAAEEERRIKADRAVWRDQGRQTTFEEWRDGSTSEKYGE